jgi:uncharacterized SAM-binding protein YcdF (DUF218 family)
MPRDLNQAVQTLWDYHQLNQTPREADIIFVLGSHDLRVAEYGAALFLKGLAPWIVFSGGIAHEGDLLKTGWELSEAETFAQIAEVAGVPRSRMIRECKAKNTGENVLFTEEILQAEKIPYDRILAVQKPYMERRAFATLKVYWPDTDITVCSPPLSLDEYPNEKISREEMIHIMVGDLQRIAEYPLRGFQIAQIIPEEVMSAYKYLMQAGYTGHLLKL